MLLVNVDEAEITEAASGLIEAIKSTKNLSCRTLRNTLYKHEYKQDHNSIVNYDAGFIENTVKHFLDLMESPNNPLNSKALERTAAACTRILIINQLFLADNDVIELGWLEREYYASSKTKWDGSLFKVDDRRISPGFIEFSGGANDATAVEKERRDIIKLYSMMFDVMDVYPSHAKFFF